MESTGCHTALFVSDCNIGSELNSMTIDLELETFLEEGGHKKYPKCGYCSKVLTGSKLSMAQHINTMHGKGKTLPPTKISSILPKSTQEDSDIKLAKQIKGQLGLSSDIPFDMLTNERKEVVGSRIELILGIVANGALVSLINCTLKDSDVKILASMRGIFDGGSLSHFNSFTSANNIISKKHEDMVKESCYFNAEKDQSPHEKELCMNEGFHLSKNYTKPGKKSCKVQETSMIENLPRSPELSKVKNGMRASHKVGGNFGIKEGQLEDISTEVSGHSSIERVLPQASRLQECPSSSCNYKGKHMSVHWHRKHKKLTGQEFIKAKREVEAEKDPTAFPHSCTKCGMKFRQKIALYYHKKRTHAHCLDRSLGQKRKLRPRGTRKREEERGSFGIKEGQLEDIMTEISVHSNFERVPPQALKLQECPSSSCNYKGRQLKTHWHRKHKKLTGEKFMEAKREVEAEKDPAAFPHSCTKCGMKFRQKVAVRFHNKRNHAPHVWDMSSEQKRKLRPRPGKRNE